MASLQIRQTNAVALPLRMRRIARAAFFTLALLVLAIALSILNNNYSFSPLSRADFTNRLDHSIAASTGWATDQYFSGSPGTISVTAEGRELVRNSALAHM